MDPLMTDPLMTEIAANAADWAVGKYAMHLPKGHRLTIWRRYYDSALAALMAFEDLNRARAVKVRAITSEN